MTTIVNIEKKVKSTPRKNDNTKPKNLPLTNCKPKPKDLEHELWSTNHDIHDIEHWLPSGELIFKELMLRKYNGNSKKQKYVKTSRTMGRLYLVKFVPTFVINKSMRRSFQRGMG
jgi:hypothetical protein